MILPVEYKPEHLEIIRPRAKNIHKGELPDLIRNNAVTICNNDLPIAIIGGYYPFPGIFHIWAIMTDDIHKQPLAFAKACKQFLTNFIRNEKPRRLQMDLRLDYPEGLKWTRFLGFELEGTMRAFGLNGEDYYLMSIVPGRK